MISRNPITTLILIASLAALGAAQAPMLDRIVPTGPRLTDAPLVEFEASFTEPVVGVDAGQFTLEGTHGGAPALDVRSPFGSELELTSTSHRAVSALNASLGSAYTVEFWAKPTAGTNGAIFSYAIFGEDNVLLFRAGGDIWCNGVQLISPVAVLTLGEWQHVAIVVNVTFATIYINGTAVHSFGATSLTPGTGVIVLGEDQDSVGGGFDSNQAFIGSIDEVRIWSTVRSSAEIQANFDKPVDPTSPFLMHYWNFDSESDLGVGSPGANDTPDLAGSLDLDLPNGTTSSPATVPSASWFVTADMTSATAGSLGLDIAATTIEDLDGMPLTANGTRLDQWVEFVTDCGAPTVTTTRTVETSRPLTAVVQFDRPVVGFDAADFDIGGIAPNGATITSVESTFGAALELASTNSFAKSGSSFFPVFGSSDYTVEAWFRSTKSDAGVVSFATFSETNALLIQAGGRVWVNGIVELSSIDVGQLDGQWHHIAVTATSGTVTRYIDGLFTGQTSASTNLGSPGVLVLGQDQDVVGGGFQDAQAIEGDIDEVRLWETARTATEIFNHYDILVNPAAADLCNYYRCDTLEALGINHPTAANDIRDIAGGRHLDAVNATTDTFVNRGTAIDVELAFASGQTAFLELDLAASNGIHGRCGTPAALPGSPVLDVAAVEDLVVSVEVNGGAAELLQAVVAPGDQMLINFASPGGTHDFVAIPSLFGQLISTGAVPGDMGAFGFPELRLDLFSPSAPFIIYDGNASGLFGPAFLPPGGITFAANAPAGLTGSSLACQPIVTSSTSTANNIFATGNVLVIDL